MKQLVILIALVALAAAIAVVSSDASVNRKTLELDGTVIGFHAAVDAKPAGPSAGDIGYTYGNLFERGKPAGRFQGVCMMLPRSGQQCTFTLGLAGGQLVIESGYGPGFNTGSVAREAVVGGTGAYAGARGEGRDREVSNTKLAFQIELIR